MRPPSRPFARKLPAIREAGSDPVVLAHVDRTRFRQRMVHTPHPEAILVGSPVRRQRPIQPGVNLVHSPDRRVLVKNHMELPLDLPILSPLCARRQQEQRPTVAVDPVETPHIETAYSPTYTRRSLQLPQVPVPPSLMRPPRPHSPKRRNVATSCGVPYDPRCLSHSSATHTLSPPLPPVPMSPPRRHMAPSQQRPNDKTLEVSPGHYERLRGSSETWRAIQLDCYRPGIAKLCRQTVFCIRDATYLLCPACKVVSPLSGTTSSHNDRSGGVGLGFTFDDLCAWYHEL